MMEPNRKTLGQKVIEWMPSQHADRERAAEQERGLANLVDFIVPQTKSEVAMSFFPFGFFGRKFVRGAKEIDKAYKAYQKQGGFSRTKFIESQFDENNIENLSNVIEDGRSWLKNWLSTYRGPNVEKTKEGMAMQDLDDIAVTLYNQARYHSVSFGKYFPKTNTVGFNRLTFLDPEMMEGFSRVEKLSPTQIMKGTAVHEFAHGVSMLGRDFENMVQKALKNSAKSDGSNIGVGSRQYSPISKKYYTLTSKKYDYHSSPTEIYATIMELRNNLNEDPRILARGFVKLQKNLVQNSAPYAKLKSVLSHKEIEKLYNNLPALVPLGLLGKNDKDK